MRTIKIWLLGLLAAVLGFGDELARVYMKNRLPYPVPRGGAEQYILGRLIDIIEGFPPVDLQTGANDGDWVNLKNAAAVAVVFVSGIGTNCPGPPLTIEQAAPNAGGGPSKALNFTVIHRKQAATSLAGTTQWTRTTQTASNTYTQTDAAEQDALWVVEFLPEDLDVANGFDHIRATVADVGGAAQPGYLYYIVVPKYPTTPATTLSYL